jgi:sorting nexin-5/6/32
LATFKKTVAMHEVFLCRLANHPVFRNDHNFRVFLEYDQDLCVRGKNKMEVIGGLMKSLTKTTDEFLLSATVKDVNDFFEQEKNFLIDYHAHLKDATAKADRMTKRHKGIYHGILQLCNIVMKYAFVITLQLCEVAESVGVLASGWTFGV